MKGWASLSASVAWLVACTAWAAGPSGTVCVATDGRGDHATVQAAIDAAPAGATEPFVILIRPGVYEHPVIVPKDKPHIVLKGEDAETTILSHPFNVNDRRPPGADKFNPGVWIRADHFRAERLTFRNTAGDRGQALALRVDGDRAIFTDCRMLGWQDTVMVNNGRHYFRNCHIEGRVDFIYGSATAVFDQCEIHSKHGGYITAASTPPDHPYGFVFLRCRLTGDPAPWPGSPNAAAEAARVRLTALGRPWTPAASVAFLYCDMGSHIDPAGWDNWRKPERERTARYVEFENQGPGANPGRRVAWSRQLTREEAAQITVASVLGGSDGWRPDLSVP